MIKAFKRLLQRSFPIEAVYASTSAMQNKREWWLTPCISSASVFVDEAHEPRWNKSTATPSEGTRA
jgi:hypothetical protein